MKFIMEFAMLRMSPYSAWSFSLINSITRLLKCFALKIRVRRNQVEKGPMKSWLTKDRLIIFKNHCREKRSVLFIINLNNSVSPTRVKNLWFAVRPVMRRKTYLHTQRIPGSCWGTIRGVLARTRNTKGAKAYRTKLAFLYRQPIWHGRNPLKL